MSEHLAGHPISTSTYTRFKCRCKGCRAAIMAYNRVRHNTEHLAAVWVKENYPEKWAAFAEEAKLRG